MDDNMFEYDEEITLIADLNDFRVACWAGHLDRAREIDERLNVGWNEARLHGRHALRSASEGGRLEVVRWLVAKYKLDSADVLASEALLDACNNDGYEVVVWLMETLDVPVETIRANDCQLFRVACQGGSLRLVKYLAERAGITASDVRSADGSALLTACSTGHLDTAEWLVESFGMTAEDMKGKGGTAPSQALHYHRIDVVQWLVKTFGVTYEGVREECIHTLRLSVDIAHPDQVRWLLDWLQPSPEEIADLQEGNPAELLASWQPAPGPGDKPALADS